MGAARSRLPPLEEDGRKTRERLAAERIAFLERVDRDLGRPCLEVRAAARRDRLVSPATTRASTRTSEPPSRSRRPRSRATAGCRGSSACRGTRRARHALARAPHRARRRAPPSAPRRGGRPARGSPGLAACARPGRGTCARRAPSPRRAAASAGASAARTRGTGGRVSAGAVRADEGVVVHGVEEGAHRGDGPPVRVTAGVDLPRMADAEAEEVPVVERVGEDACGVRRRHRVARPDVRDARGDLEPVGRRKEHGRVGERLPACRAPRSTRACRSRAPRSRAPPAGPRQRARP